MITLSAFQQYLSSRASLPQTSRKYLNEQEQQLLKWAANLPVQTEAQQARQIEQILTELTVGDLEDELRLKLASIVISASDRLVTSLHAHYIYELGALNEEQLTYVEQVKSLYYLNILVYDGIVQRESLALNYQQRTPTMQGWKRFLSATKTLPLLLAVAIYQSLIVYQKLLHEIAILYQQPPQHLWAAFNQLYNLACQHNIAHVDLSTQVAARQAISIHDLYSQMCLYSLLNVYAMRRSNIILVHRLLPLWADHINATIEPQTHTRVFVDLQSDNSPDYLTANSTINPYDEDRNCLFIDLEPLAVHLQERQQALFENGNMAIEYQLISKVLMTINHRYIERHTSIPTRYSPKQRATIITDFNDIHYHVAGARNLTSIIMAENLPIEQLPRYDTQQKRNAKQALLEVDTFDSTDTVSHFRALHLLAAQDRQAPTEDGKKRQVGLTKTQSSLHTSMSEPMVSNNANYAGDTTANIGEDSSTINPADTAPPPMQLMTMFLLCRPNNDTKLKWSLGMVRWLNLKNEYTEVEWQVMGHALTACGLRLDDRDNRSANFMPAFIVAGDDELQTEYSVIVPSYHFKTADKVIIRIKDQQKMMRLTKCVLSTEEFSQYKVEQL